jgi:ABC-type cobalamin/Fe3+-siderophores transport system ATPase subunit
MSKSSTRASVPISFPLVGEIGGFEPIVVIGPNGVGKSRMMRQVAGSASRFISAQRRTYLEEQIPTSRSDQSKAQMNNQLQQAHSNPWQLSNEIDYLFGRILQEHYAALDASNETAKESGRASMPVTETSMDRLKSFWQAVFVNRRLSFSDFSPTAQRIDIAGQAPYPAKTMSDGERTCLYLAARVLTAEPGMLVVDEPELHMHRKLSIDYWNKLEEMRPDIRFVYVTHDLHFGLSRQDRVLLVVLDDVRVERASIDELPHGLTEALLGAATLTTNAQRIVFFEGVSGKGLASAVFKKWIRGGKSAAIGLGSRSFVLDAGGAFAQLGIINNAVVVAVVDRDHGPESWLATLKPPAFVLPLHEIESLFALPVVLRAAARHFAYAGPDVWQAFLERARHELEVAMPKMVAERVRARIGALLDGAFSGSQIKETVADTAESHAGAMEGIGSGSTVRRMFVEEESWIRAELARPDHGILVPMSGKQALTVAANVLGIGRHAYANVVLEAIDRPKHSLHGEIVAEWAKYLPPRE